MSSSLGADNFWKRGQNKNSVFFLLWMKERIKSTITDSSSWCKTYLKQNRHLFDFTPYFCGIHQRTADEIYLQFTTRFAHTHARTHNHIKEIEFMFFCLFSHQCYGFACLFIFAMCSFYFPVTPRFRLMAYVSSLSVTKLTFCSVFLSLFGKKIDRNDVKTSRGELERDFFSSNKN